MIVSGEVPAALAVTLLAQAPLVADARTPALSAANPPDTAEGTPAC